MFSRIVVPLDGSPLSEKALPYAMEMARRFGSDVLLIQAISSVFPEARERPENSPPVSKLDVLVKQAHGQDQRLKSAAEQYLASKVRDLEAGKVKGSYHVFVSTPFHTMMDYCVENGIDLVVMTTHGVGGLKRAIIGSTADKVVRESRIPVLLIRPTPDTPE